MRVRTIESLANRDVKQWVRLRKGRFRRKMRRFLAEGERPLERARAAGWRPLELIVWPEGLTEGERRLLEAWAEVPRTEVSAPVMRRIAVRERPSGLVAVMPWQAPAWPQMRADAEAFYLVAAAVEKPGNVGALFRSADGAGAAGVIIADEPADPYHPHAVRNSAGTVFTLPWTRLASEAAIERLRRARIRIAVATPDAPDTLWEAPLDAPVAVVVGTEHRGVADVWRRAADVLFAVPMLGTADSLNVSVSAALALYEVRRRITTAPS